jgi:hypothetical protein
MATGIRAARVPDSLVLSARNASPDLARLDFSTLVRAGLAALAGHKRDDAIRIATDSRQPPHGAGRPRRVA